FAKKVEAAGRKPSESASKTSAAGSSESALLRTLVGQQATAIRLLREIKDAPLPVAESDEEDEDVLLEASAVSSESSVAPSDPPPSDAVDD
ncbi:MAG: hypothetical protein M1823_006443, partial [Watsoniomyces obsoletus]